MAEQQLGKYAILEEMGRGGFATVYHAHDTVLQRDVALKILHPALVTDPQFVTRFENDARAAAQLEHPHIVTVHELGQLEGRLYIVMQYLPSGSLATRLESIGPLVFTDAVHVLEEVAAALDYAHAKGFVHRDVKPSNVLFNTRGEAVVTDFGLVKAVESSIVARSSAGGVIGTPAYIAPEVWEGKAATPAADVYALGCVLYEMLTGEALFRGDSSPAVMMAHFQPHRYPETWPEGVPVGIQDLLEQALARDAGARHSSAGAFAKALRELAARAADPLSEPYKALQQDLAAEEWAQALQSAGEIQRQQADYRDVAALAQRAAEGQARAERAQWATQWRAQALAAEQAGQVEAARVALQRWLEMAPENPEAQALQGRLEQPVQAPAAEAFPPVVEVEPPSPPVQETVSPTGATAQESMLPPPLPTATQERAPAVDTVRPAATTMQPKDVVPQGQQQAQSRPKAVTWIIVLVLANAALNVLAFILLAVFVWDRLLLILWTFPLVIGVFEIRYGIRLLRNPSGLKPGRYVAVLEITALCVSAVWSAYIGITHLILNNRSDVKKYFQSLAPPQPPADTTEPSLRCPNCGYTVRLDAGFCPNCGKVLS